jgi:hypothetical protein
VKTGVDAHGGQMKPKKHLMFRKTLLSVGALGLTYIAWLIKRKPKSFKPLSIGALVLTVWLRDGNISGNAF